MSINNNENKKFIFELIGDYGQKVHCSMDDQDLLYLINSLSNGQLFMDLIGHLQSERPRQYIRLFPSIQLASRQIVGGINSLMNQIDPEDPDEEIKDENDDEPMVGVIANE